MSKLNKEETLSLLNRFVDRERKNLSKPFSQELKIGKYLCATDAHMVLLIPETEENKIEDEVHYKLPPSVDRILPEFTDDIEVDFEHIIQLYSDVKIINRRITQQCDSCEGEGTFEHYGNWYECKECNEKGFVNTHRYEDVKNPDTAFSFNGFVISIQFVERMIRVYEIVKPKTFKIVKFGFILWVMYDEIVLGVAGLRNDEDEEKKHDIVIVNLN